ncbi:MAG: chromosomal replication initiator protein DnaA [Oscillospiraceae bacterium]|nr:chromosomal replication initiator protein DnaA [Oscillospiraceae bacterium]
MAQMRQISDFEQVFELVSDYCKGKLSDVAHALWIRDLTPVSLEDGVATLVIETTFRRNMINEKHFELLREAYTEIMGYEVEVNILSEEEMGLREAGPRTSEVTADCGDGYTFDSFVVGSSNKFAHAASLAVATNPSNAYNPLFIYGDSGLGKTHLLNAICNEIAKSYPDRKQLFVHGESFTNELIQAIQDQTTAQFHHKYRSADVLLMDDVQFIGGKDRTQEEFFHTFNALYQDSKQIILTSDRPPKEIRTLEDRLRTRFEWGLLADVQPPDFETRAAIIQRKAEQIEFDVPDDVIEYIANRLKNNIRQLEGAVKKMKAYKMLQGMEPSIVVAQTSIKDVLNDTQPVPVTIERILTEVGRTYGVSPVDIRSNKRNSNISAARQVSAYVVKEITQISMAAIGKDFGNRDHSTIVYAVQQVERNMAKDTQLKEMVNDIIRNIKGS